MADRRGCRMALLIALFAVLWTGVPVAVAAAPARDVVGNTYTSPTFSHTVTWPDTWFVVEEKSEVADILVLTDGVTYAHFVGQNLFAGNAQAALAALIVTRSQDKTISNFQPMRDGSGKAIRGGDANRAFAVFTQTITFEDGATGNFSEYIETRTLIEGRAVLIFFAYQLLDFYESERPAVDQLLAGLVLPVPPEPELIAGEPGPVYVSGAWRVAVAAAVQNESLPSVGLKAKGGKEWLVVVADVTNWSDGDAEFAAKDFAVRVVGSGAPKKLAPASTKTVAKQLDLAPVSSDLKVTIPAGKTTRIALAFQLPAGSEEPMLVRGEDALPLTDVLVTRIDADDLPALAGPAKVTKGEITGAADGETVRVQLANKDSSNKIRLLGVDAPAKGDCYADEAKAFLAELDGQSVLLERDAAISGGSGTVRYVWLVNPDGSRTLLNRQMIAEGFAESGAIPEDARFAAWFEASERDAEAASVGLWTACAAPQTPAATAAPSGAGTPVASPAGSPEASPTAKSS